MSSTLPPDDSLAWKVWLGSVVSVALATIAVAARLAARRTSAAPFWWDDYTILASLVSMTLTWRLPDWSIHERLTLLPGGAMGHGDLPMDYSWGLLLRPSCCLRGTT